MGVVCNFLSLVFLLEILTFGFVFISRKANSYYVDIEVFQIGFIPT